MPEGISAVVHAEPPACDGADEAGAVVEFCGLVPALVLVVPATEDCAGAELDVELVPAAAAPPEPEDPAGADEELALPDKAPVLLAELLPEQPAVKAMALNAPAAMKAETRFMGTHPFPRADYSK